MGCAGSKYREKAGRLGRQNSDKTTATIYPKPCYVLKTQRMVSSDKFFINVCTAEEMWPFPAVLVSDLREDVDKRGNHCQCVDAVVHPEALMRPDNSKDTVNLVIIRKVVSELVRMNNDYDREVECEVSFPVGESLSEEYKLPIVQNNYKGKRVVSIEMGLKHLSRSSLKSLEKAADTFVLLGKFKGMRNAFENVGSSVDKRVLNEHAAKLIQTAWRHHKKHILMQINQEEQRKSAATSLQSLFRAKAARKSVTQLKEDLVRTGGFPEPKTGHIVKRGHIFRSWRDRYFVLERGVVSYYTDEKMKKQKGEIAIRGYHVTNHSKLDSEELYLSAGESGGKDLLLSFKDTAEKDQWRAAFEAHIGAYENEMKRELSMGANSRI